MLVSSSMKKIDLITVCPLDGSFSVIDEVILVKLLAESGIIAR